MRIILYTGKGGVGKTSISAASAVRLAELGHKTLVFSSDVAHSLGDSFDIELTHQPKEIAPNLWGQETNINESMKSHWGTIRDWLTTAFSWQSANEIVAEEIAVLPGMEELANLLYILDYFDKGEYDALVVDCAPTGETLRLLSFPEVMQWWMERIFPLERKILKMVRPMARNVLNVPLPGEDVMNSFQDLFAKVTRMNDLLKDPDKTSVRLVVNPEKMVIKEAQRTYTYLNLYGYYTDMVACNRVLPKDASEGYFATMKAQQAKYLVAIDEAFSPIPIRYAPFFGQEVVGLKMLGKLADSMFEKEDPYSIFYKGKAQYVENDDGDFVYNIVLPFISKEKINLSRRGDEMTIEVGVHRRNIILPQALTTMEVESANLEDGKLKIVFHRESKKPRTKKKGGIGKTHGKETVRDHPGGQRGDNS